MLYERWLQIACDSGDHLALWDGATDRSWTFEQLCKEVEQLPDNLPQAAFVTGSGHEFILGVLHAWRRQSVVVPLERGQTHPNLEQPIPDGIVHLKTTSATTGPARLIAFTEQQLVADCENIVATMGLAVEMPNVGAISLSHSYGFSNLVLPLLLKGVPLLLAGSALPESVRKAIEQSERVALPSVPALWQAWFDADISFDRIQIAISAGAPLPLPLERRVFEDSGVKIHNFYGSSECGGIAYDQTERPREEATFVGTHMHGVEVYLDEQGSVLVKSEAVGTGYWPVTEGSLENGFFRTGDLGEINDGQIHLRGRACDRINVAGRKVIPDEVEREVLSHPAVKDCLVFGVPCDHARNETIVACVSYQNGSNPPDLNEYLRTRLDAWKMPREWWVLDSMDSNERGKRSRTAWRERYLVARVSTDQEPV